MEFDIRQLDYLEFKFLEVTRTTKVSMFIYYQDLKRKTNLVLIVFDKAEHEKVIYKLDKALHKTKLTEKLLYRDTINGFPFLVMERQGPTLSQLFQFQNSVFSSDTVMLIGYRLIKMLEQLHKRNIIYNFLSPENIVVNVNMSKSNFFFTNFDNAVKKKIICDSKKIFLPNKFCSLNAHFGIFPSFRDDLESLAYLLVYFKTGGEFFAQLTSEQLKSYKLALVLEDYFKSDFPEEVIIMFNYVKLLGFDEFPNYGYLLSLFESFFQRNGVDKDNTVYDWIKTMIEMDANERGESQDESSAI